MIHLPSIDPNPSVPQCCICSRMVIRASTFEAKTFANRARYTPCTRMSWKLLPLTRRRRRLLKLKLRPVRVRDVTSCTSPSGTLIKNFIWISISSRRKLPVVCAFFDPAILLTPFNIDSLPPPA